MIWASYGFVGSQKRSPCTWNWKLAADRTCRRPSDEFSECTEQNIVVHATIALSLTGWNHVNNNMMWHRATITSHKKLSPTVTGLTLKLDKSTTTTNSSSSSFTFIPGQWVDFQPTSSSWKPNKDDNKTIGGYSITSIPKSLPLSRISCTILTSYRHTNYIYIDT